MHQGESQSISYIQAIGKEAERCKMQHCTNAEASEELVVRLQVSDHLLQVCSSFCYWETKLVIFWKGVRTDSLLRTLAAALKSGISSRIPFREKTLLLQLDLSLAKIHADVLDYSTTASS